MGNFAWVFDVFCLLAILGIGYAVGSEGIFGAAVMFMNVMFAGLITFSIYEPAARVVGGIMGPIDTMADFSCIIVIFALVFTVIRLVTDYLAPWYVRFHGAVDQIGRYLFGLATGFYMVGMIVCAVETAPVHKMFMGYQWQTHSLWGVGVDRFWLAFVHTTTEKYMEWDPPRSFDPNCDFIMRYHRWRPFGEPDITLPGVGAPAQTAGQGAGNGGVQPQGGQGGGGGGGRPPVDPTGGTQLPSL
jgi:hypothetical protein